MKGFDPRIDAAVVFNESCFDIEAYEIISGLLEFIGETLELEDELDEEGEE